MCVNVHGIFLGVLYKTVIPLQNGTSLRGKLQTFFVHVSMSVLIITYLLFIACQCALQNAVLFSIYIANSSDAH